MENMTAIEPISELEPVAATPPVAAIPPAAAAPTWADSKPLPAAPAPASDAVPKWEDSTPIDNRLFTPSKKGMAALKTAFAGDPLAFIEDPAIKRDLEFQLERGGDAETEKKKWALAAYFAGMRREDVRFAYGNLDQLIERYNGGKPASVDQAFNDVAKLLNPPQPGEGGAAEVGKAGFAGPAKMAVNLSSVFLNLASMASPEYGTMTAKERAALHGGIEEMRQRGAGYWGDVYKKNEGTALDEEWFSRWNNGRWLTNAGKFLAIQAPQQAVQLAAAKYMGPLAFMGTIGASTGIDKYYDLKDENPELPEEQRLKNAALTGVINSGAAWLTAGIVKGKIPVLNRVQFKGEIRATIAYFGTAMGIEAGQEFFEQLAENATDLHTGVFGDAEKMSPAKYKKHLWNGVGEASLAGGAFGIGGAGVGFRSFRAQRAFAHGVRNQAEQEKARLLAIENPTAEDVAALDQVNSALDSGNLNDLAAVAHGVAEVEAERQQQRSAADAELSAEEILQRDGDEAAMNFAARRMLPHNPQDVADAVTAASREIRGTVFHVVEGPQEYPAAVVAEAERRGYDNKGHVPRAFFYRGEVYFDASRIRPSEVPKLITHEVGIHKGLRAIIPAKYLDPLLDRIYAEHFQDSTFNQVASDYFSQNVIVGEDGSRTVNLENPADQRYAAEEYMAALADQKGVKPSWWRELLQQIRMGMARIGFLREVRMTDRELETLIARSVRASRRGRFGEASRVEGPDGVRFALEADRLTGEAVAAVPSGAIHAGNGLTAIDAAMSWAKEHLPGSVDTEIGPVDIDAAAIRQSLSHTIYQTKLDAIQALDEVLSKGVYLGEAADKDGRPIQNYFFAAPVMIGDARKLVFVRTRKGKGGHNRFYVHEVFTEDEITKLGSQQTDSASGNPDRSYRNASEFYRTIIASVMNVKSENGENTRFSLENQTETPEFKRWFGDSKVVDENGKPLVVYHGSESEFFAFDPDRTGHGHDQYGSGFYFTTNQDEADGYQGALSDNGKTIAAYLSLQKPIIAKGDNLDEADIDLTLQQAYKIIKKAPGIYDPDNSPIGDFVDIWRAGRVTESMIREVASNYTGFSLISLESDFFRGKSTAFRQAVYDVTGNDGVIHKFEDGTIHFVAWFPTQIKSATDNIGTFDPENPDIRYSLADYSEADRRDIVAMLRPIVGTSMAHEDAEFVDFLASKGVTGIPPRDARAFAAEAVGLNLDAARNQSKKLRDDWLYQNVPVWRAVVDQLGTSDFKIRPSKRFAGEEFTGSWIAKKKDKQFTDSDTLAEAIARKQGRDALDVEQEIVDFFLDLKKPDLYKHYVQFRSDQAFADKEAEKAARAEFEAQLDADAEAEAIRVLQAGAPITSEWIAENRDVFGKLYEKIFPGQAVPSDLSSIKLETINAALTARAGDAAGFADAYRQARDAAWTEYRAKLAELRQTVLDNRAEAAKLQRDAVIFAEKNIPKENRSEFSRAIVNLLEFPTSPSAKNPQGRRAAEFDKLISGMVERGAELRKSSAVEEIKTMLEAARIKRNYKGIPTSVLPSEQGRVERIRQIVNMDLPAVANLIAYNTEQISLLEDMADQPAQLENLQEDNALLEMFGNLSKRPADDASRAARALQELITGGKAAFRDKLNARKAEVEEMRRRAVDDATFGKNEYHERGDAAKHWEYTSRGEPLGTLMRLVSGKSIQDFDNSLAGDLYRKVEASTQDEATGIRRMQQDFDSVLRDVTNVTGKTRLAAMRAKGKFFRSVSEIQEKTGVFKTEYSRAVSADKSGNVVFEHGRRQLVSKTIPIEDYQFYGTTRKGARSLLADLDNAAAAGRTAEGAVFDGMVLDDTAIAFLRQQLADHDAGLKQSYEIFNEESDDANFNRMIEEERKTGKLVIFSHDPNEQSRRVEVPLSQGAALQILLTWEQQHYQPNMKWNGWSEESIAQLKKFIRPEVLKVGEWMRDYIAANKAALDEKVFDRYGAHLPPVDGYFPAAFRGGKTKAVKVESELGRGAGSMSINPNFLIARKFHLKPVDTDADAFSSFLGNQLEQNHFLAWSDSIRDLKSVYGSSMVQKAINESFGKAVTDNLVERLETLARGGGTVSGDYATRMMGKLYRHWIPAKIALNVSSAIKQMFGVAAYMNHVPVVDFARYMARANFTNPEFREFVKFARETDYFKNRLGGGLDKDLLYMLNWARDNRSYSPFSDALMQVGSWQTRASDAWSTLHGGFAAYKYNLELAKRSGMNPDEARRAAQLAWQRATDETQQSGYLKDQNYFQANQGAYRYLTAFLTNPIQLMNLQLQTVNEIRYGSDKKAAYQKLGRQILVNHFILPTLMQFTNDILRAGFNFSDFADEFEFEDYFLAWAMGQFEAAFLFGKAFSELANYGADKLLGRNTYGKSSVFSAIPLADDLIRDIDGVARLVKADEITEKELLDMVRAAGDAAMTAGVADSRIGSIGALLHAIGAQGKRLAKWVNPE